MIIENDFSDMVHCLTTFDCKFIIVGGFALAFNGYVRNTGDMDFFIEPSTGNSEKVYKALKLFGAPLNEINLQAEDQKI